MTLNTTTIKRYGEKLYKQLSGYPYLGADACADAYAMFVRRLSHYRAHHPETVRVSEAFVKKCERWITANLLAKKKRRRIRETTELELAKRTHDAPAPVKNTGNTVLFIKLEGFFSQWIKESPKAAEYARLYLLFHAWSLNARRVRLFLPLVPGKKSEFVRAVKRIKRHVAERTAARASVRVRDAQYWYAQSVRAAVAANERTGKKRTAALARGRECEKRQRNALSRLGQVTYRPALQYIANTAGVTVEQVRHAVRVCEREIKTYFG
jgi:hypothetical protein